MEESQNNNNVSFNSDLNFDHKDYSVVKNPARIAIYDDLKSPPRILEIKPNRTNEFIETLSSTIYNEAQNRGGTIPYTVIREVTENFIHASFKEIVVSVLDKGNTIRFADQGPGFYNIEESKLPGFTSATESMKQYIRGVGSGLPTVNEYLTFSNGFLKIENNLDSGAVVTISVVNDIKDSVAFSKKDINKFNQDIDDNIQNISTNLKRRHQRIILLLKNEGLLGVSEISNKLSMPTSTVHKDLITLQNLNIVEKKENKKRSLSQYGYQISNSL